MPASTSPFIQEFLNKTPVSTDTLANILISNTGLRNGKLYAYPTNEDSAKVQELCKTLQAFEDSALANIANVPKTRMLMNKITSLANDLELEMVRPIESGTDDDWIMFTPKIVDPNKPLKVHAILVYRFGLIIDKEISNTDYTVNNLALVSEHAGQDGTDRLAADLFLQCKTKFLLSNVLLPHAVKNPDHVPGTGRENEYLTDPAHSDTTIFLPILRTLLQEQFREIPVLVLHGMGAPQGNKFQALMGNCYGNFRKDGWRSFANMLGISFGIEDYYISKDDEAQDIPFPVIAFASQIPNSVLKGNAIIPMSATEPGLTDGALRWAGRAISSNVTGHIGYFAEDVLDQRIAKGYKLASDRMIHVETTGYIRTNEKPNSETRDKFVNVVQRAIRMYRRYDPAIHDPHKLSSRFVERARNMKLYPELFRQETIDRYKKNKAEIYASDSAAYEAEFAENKQLPPPLETTASQSPRLLFSNNMQKSGKTEEFETESCLDGEDTIVQDKSKKIRIK